MSKNLSAKYYQENKARMQKKLVKDIKIFVKKKKKKSGNMVVNDTKINQKMKSKNLLGNLLSIFLSHLYFKSSLTPNKKCESFVFQVLQVLS